MTKIQTRPFIFGDEKESEWPPRFPTCRGFRGYWDSESRTFKEGTPPPREKKYGDAPAIFTDSIEPYYHPAAGITVDSKSALRDLDKACGTITTDKKLPPDPTEQKARAEKRRKEGTEALHKAVAQIDAGTAPLTEAQRAACTKENERLSSALNFDAFNVAGRKNDRRGKRWKNVDQNKESNPLDTGLSRRDAIGVALEELNAREAKAAPSQEAEEKEEVSAAQEKPKFEAPSEWSKEEKEDFNQGTSRQQEAALRLHKSRSSTLERIKQEAADLQWVKELSQHVDPYLKARGYKGDPKQAIIDALEMKREIDEKPISSSAAILKSEGFQPPKELLDLDKDHTVVDHEKEALQKRLEALESKATNEEVSRVKGILSEAWNEFASSRNAAGEPRYPDVLETETGPNLARNIGSLVDGVTPLSRQFIANVEARIPDLTLPRLIEEAYKYYGGQVSDSTHLGLKTRKNTYCDRVVQHRPFLGELHSSSNAVVKKYKTRREAAEAALAELREREGH